MMIVHGERRYWQILAVMMLAFGTMSGALAGNELAPPEGMKGGLNGNDLAERLKPACMVAGCSNQHCIPAGATLPSLANTCEWREEYGCYSAYGDCAMSSDGTCGWQPNEEFNHCMEAIQKTQQRSHTHKVRREHSEQKQREPSGQ